MLQPVVCQPFVHLHPFCHGPQFVFCTLFDHLPDLGDCHGTQLFVERITGVGAVALLEQDLIIPLGKDDIGMCIADLADPDPGGGDDLCPGIETRFLRIDHDDHMVPFHQLDGGLAHLWGDVLQELEAFFRIPQAGAKSGGIF